MKKFDFKEFINDFIGGFKQIFKSTDNIKVILALVLALFLVLFIAMGGCASCGCQGLVRCDGCGSSEGGSPGKGDDVKDEVKVETMFDGMTPAAASIKDEFEGVAATIYYPSEMCTYTEDTAQFWANWVGRIAVAADGKFSIQPDFDYISNSYKADGSNCSTFDEVKQSFQERYGSSPETYGELKLGKNSGFWYVYGGYTTAVFPVLDTNRVLEIYLIPADLDQNAADATAKASALMQDEELISILGTLQITAIDAIPDASTAVFYKNQADNTGEPAQNGGSGADAPSVPGETYDTGVFTTLVPEGWKAFPSIDIFSEEENAIDPESVQLGKGASDEFELLVNPSISVTYYGPDFDLMTPDSSWYDNATELSGFALGDFSWNGFEAEDFMGGKVIILWTDSVNGVEYQANISYDPASHTISANDADVQAILASLKAN